MKNGLSPLVGENPRILILGSLPGDESIRLQQYYANPKNLFWQIMEGIFEEPVSTTYPERCAFLAKHHIALWDILSSADREGSVDAHIKNPLPNDIIGFLNEHPSIQVIAMNGGKAKKDFIKMARPHYEFFKDYSLYGLASSSSLVKSAGWTLESLTDQWKIIANK